MLGARKVEIRKGGKNEEGAVFASFDVHQKRHITQRAPTRLRSHRIRAQGQNRRRPRMRARAREQPRRSQRRKT